MIRFFLALLGLFLTAGMGVNAEILQVQSGEHADFSRVVIQFEDVPEWRFGRVEDGYELRTTERDASFGLDTVFDFIPRSRISNLQDLRNGRLLFNVACDCHADIFEIRSGLVIDIKDGPPDQHARFENELPEIIENNSVEVASISPKPRPDVPTNMAVSNDPPETFRYYAAPRTPFVWRDGLGAPHDMKPDMVLPDSNPMPMTEDVTPNPPLNRVAAVQDELILQIGRAASQGLVSADMTETKNRLTGTSSTPAPGMTPDVPAVKPEMAADLERLGDAATGGNVRFETSVDRARLNSKPTASMTIDGIGCLPSDQLDVASWGTPANLGDPVTLSRTSLLGEFDIADPSRIEQLAKQYLYLTFGAEARALINAFDVNVPNSQLLMNIANIMDAGEATNPVLGIAELQCDTNVALWAALSLSELPRTNQIEIEAILGSFAELPLHLRRHLGPFLAERFLGIGDSETASAIRNTIARAPGDHGDGLAMIEAEIAMVAGRSADGSELLSDIIRQDGPLAPEAVVRLIDATLDGGSQLPTGLMATAAALAAEARGTDMGAELKRVYLRSVAHSGDGLRALRETAKAANEKEITAGAISAIRREIFDFAVENIPDPEFLQLALDGQLNLGNSNEATNIRRKIAIRLIDLGLTVQARDVLSEEPDVPAPQDRRIYARAFLAERRPELAMGYLAGLTDSESLALRAKALEFSGEFDQAAENYAQLGDDVARARAVWRGKNWLSAAQIGSDAEKAAAELLFNTPDNGDALGGSLAESQQLLARSQSARMKLAALLAATRNP